MDDIEPIERVRHRVGLVELERVVRLRLDVDTNHIEARAVVAHPRAAGPAEQVKQSWAGGLLDVEEGVGHLVLVGGSGALAPPHVTETRMTPLDGLASLENGSR